MSDQQSGAGDPNQPEGGPPGWGQPPQQPPPGQPPGKPLNYPLQPPPWQPPLVEPTAQCSRLGVSIGGFFAGVAWLIVVPGVMVSIGATWWPDFVTPGLLFTTLVTLGGPTALLFAAKTRRFGAFMLIGMAVTAIVVAGVCVAFIALLVSAEGS